MSSTTVDVRELLKAGAHFGHRVSHWNPKMGPYIHSERGGIYIIDLIKTVTQLERALDFAEEVASRGKQILFVGTKRHLRGSIETAAKGAGMPYIIERWFGGTLTNFATINKRVKYLRETEEKLASGKLAETMNKRELGETREQLLKLNVLFGGLKEMVELPEAVFVVDAITDGIAVREAARLGIPVIAIVDTNADPSLVDYVIAANDDAVSSVSLISNLLAEAIKRGRARMAKVKPAANTDAQTTDKPKPSPAKAATPTKTKEKADAK